MKDGYSSANILAHRALIVNADRICFVNQEPLQFFLCSLFTPMNAGIRGALKGNARCKREH
jgi:hypothetical protein